MDIFTLTGKIVLEGIDKAKEQLSGFGNVAKSTGDFIERNSKKIALGVTGTLAATGTFAAQSVKLYASVGSEIYDMAIKTGLGAEAISELRYAAEQSGTSLSGLEVAIRQMAGTIVNASEGSDTAQKAFERIGIKIQDLIGLSPEEQFNKIASGVASLQDATLRAATAQDIFGRSGTDLLPLLSQGVDAMSRLKQEAHDLGITFTDVTAARAEQLANTLNRFNEQLKGIQFSIAEGITPSLEWWSGVLTRNDSELKKWIDTALDWQWVADQNKEIDKVWGTVTLERTKYLAGMDNEYERAVKLLEQVLRQQGLLNENTSKAITGMKDEIAARKELNKETAKTTEELEKEQKARDDLTKNIEDTRKQYEYERSDAGKLNVTLDDVIFKLYDMGWNNEQVTKTLWDLGKESNNVNALLKAVGLTASDVKQVLDDQKDSVDGLSNAYGQLGNKIMEMQEQAALLQSIALSSTGTTKEQAIAAYNDLIHTRTNEILAANPGMTGPEAALKAGSELTTNPTSKNIYGQELEGYQHGGPILGDTLLTRLSDMEPYAVAHAGESVIPAGAGGVLITGNTFNVRDDRDIDRIGQSIVDKIRLKTGLRI